VRDIKFRAWEKNLKEIIPVHNIDFVKRMLNTESAWRRFDEIELIQYTGLKDKNDKEIFEGDLIKVNGSEELDLVKYLDGSYYGVNPKYHNTLRYNLDYKTRDIAELIGNIYENPELLEN
jgi:uncharacterized phage protein (TIGR01671 family)